MSLHKLTAGDGYTYLTRQVAALDGDELGRTSLESYYSEKGERPGVWHGRGAATLGIEGQVSEAQMRALFGEGRHPDADAIEARMIGAGAGVDEALAATKLGRTFPMYESPNRLRTRVAQAVQQWNLDRGEKAGAEVPDTVREEIRTREAREMFAAEHGRPARDARELSGYVARQSRPAKVATAGYDLTFTPIKSFSVLWALAPMELANRLEDIHSRGVDHALAFLEHEAAFTRKGAQGVRQVETNGLLIARFTHRDNRAGEANLHTHATVSNKVQERTDDSSAGPWLALDGRMMHRLAVAASEQYNAFIERTTAEEIGATFADRAPRGGAGRAVREIAEVDPVLCEINSSRSAAIDVRQAELARQFQLDHGRTPTPVEALRLAQTATLDTRQRKHEPRSYLEQRTAWRLRAESALGRAGIGRMLARFDAPPPAQPFRLDRDEIARVAAGLRDDVLQVVSEHRAQWQMQHVMAEAARQVTRLGLPVDVAAQVEAAVIEACADPAQVVAIEPVDGMPAGDLVRAETAQSQYTVHLSQTYTTARIVEAEQRIVTAAGLMDGRIAPPSAVDIAILTMAANGIDLNAGQASMVRELATSGARVQLALAPAGTGKTTAMQALSDAWREAGGTVVGLAPSAAAAIELGKATGGINDTIDSLVHALSTPGVPIPEWVDALDATSLVIIDEAGMASTSHLDRTIGFVLDRGASVRLIGDDQQLASVAAGGVLRDLQSVHGALTLTEVVRFTDPAEGPASLALRAGDTAAIAFYLDNDRVRAGDLAGAVDQAYEAWTRDVAAGPDAILMAPTRALTAQLNQRAQTDRIAAAGGTVGPQLQLRNGETVSAGDVIVTTKNARRLKLRGTDFVRNGYRWRVEAVNGDGSLRVAHMTQGVTRTLPGWYIDEGHVALGYAATVHKNQGITADVAHAIIDPSTTRQLLYVGLTRGRHGNHAYVPVVGAGDEHSLPHADTWNPRTGGEVLAAIIGRDGSQLSATTAIRQAGDPRARLHFEAQRYADSLRQAAERRLGPDRLAELTAQLESAVPGVTAAPAWPTLRSHLALLALDGRDPADAALAAIAGRELTTAVDVAAVIDWRLDPLAYGLPAGPLPWLQGGPAALAEDPDWGPVFAARRNQVLELAAAVDQAARSWTPGRADTPVWARPLVEARAHPKLIAQLAVWRAAQGVDDEDRRAAGPPVRSVAERAIHRRLAQGAQSFMTDHTAGGRGWHELAETIDSRLLSDPYWPLLAARLDLAQQLGIDATALATAVAAYHPLPDEQPAAALWWRLSRHLNHTPAIADNSAGGINRPDWARTLDELLGEDQAVMVLTDPMWPAVVATVDQAGDGADALFAEAAAAAAAAAGDIAPADLATAILWRASLLTDPDRIDVDELPPDPAEPEYERPADLDDLPVAASVEQVDWERADQEQVDLWEPSAEDLAYALENVDEPPMVRALPHADLDPADRVDAIAADIEVLRHQLGAVDAAITANRSPNVLAISPMLTDMRHRADQLTPYAAAAAYARRNWAEAAQIAEQYAGDARAAAPDEVAGASRLAEGAQVYATRMRAEYDRAMSALHEAAGGPEHVVSHADADHVMFTARGLDLDRVAEVRRDLIALKVDHARAELSAARAASPTPAEEELLASSVVRVAASASQSDTSKQRPGSARPRPGRPAAAPRSAGLQRLPDPRRPSDAELDRQHQDHDRGAAGPWLSR